MVKEVIVWSTGCASEK